MVTPYGRGSADSTMPFCRSNGRIRILKADRSLRSGLRWGRGSVQEAVPRDLPAFDTSVMMRPLARRTALQAAYIRQTIGRLHEFQRHLDPTARSGVGRVDG